MVYYPVTLDLTKTNRGMNSFTIVALLFFSFFKTAGIFWRVPKHHLSGELFKHLMEKRSKNTHPNSYPDTSKIELKNEG